jgi:hypothetical protein
VAETNPFLWDTCAIIWSKSQPPIPKTCTRRVQFELQGQGHYEENLKIIDSEEPGSKVYADSELLEYSLRGFRVVTGDRTLIRRINRKFGKVVHVSNFWRAWKNFNYYGKEATEKRVN